MIWSDFKSEIHYNYIKLLLKDLSPAEHYYLNALQDGIDEQISSVIDWIEKHKKDLDNLDDKSEFEEYYLGSSLEEVWLTLLSSNVNKGVKPLYNFYRNGGDLAYTHMNKSSMFLDSDKKALDNLNNYVGSVVNSINGEFAYGVKNLIGESIESNRVEELNTDLLELRSKPIDSRFSVDTRCLFTAKTEYARCINTGLLQAYSNYGVDDYDWITSGLPTTCKQCVYLEANSPYTLDEIIRLACPHVNCVCSFKANLPNNLHPTTNPRIVDLTPKKK